MHSESEAKWWIECGASPPNAKFIRNHLVPAHQTNKFRFEHNNIGIYQTAYMYDSKDQTTANLLGDFYLDFDYDLDGDDSEKAFDIVRKDVLSSIKYFKVIMGIDSSDIQIFFSGSKGVHLIIPKEIFGIKPHPRLNRHFRSMAEEINKYTVSKSTIDLKIYDSRRLFRIPNSIHQKSRKYKIYLSYDELKTLSLAQIQELANKPVPIPRKKYFANSRASLEFNKHVKVFEDSINRKRQIDTVDFKLDYTPSCVQYLFDNEVKQGQRNSTAAFLVSFFKQCGMSEEEAISKLEEWNEARCFPKLREGEVVTTVRSIFNGSAKMGCATGKDLSQCSEDCRFNKKNRRPGQYA